MSIQNQTPPLLQWRVFADWIGMGKEHKTVKGWIDQGLLPSIQFDGITMVNVLALKQELLSRKA